MTYRTRRGKPCARKGTECLQPSRAPRAIASFGRAPSSGNARHGRGSLAPTAEVRMPPASAREGAHPSQGSDPPLARDLSVSILDRQYIRARCLHSRCMDVHERHAERHATTVFFPFRMCTIIVFMFLFVSIYSLLVLGSSCFHTWQAVLRAPKGMLVMATRLRVGTECSGVELVPYALNAIGLRGFGCLASARRTACVAS